MLWISSTTTKGGFPPFMGPYGAAKAAMDSLAVTLAYEIARFGIETSIVVPGAFTRGTDHFPSAGKPADANNAAPQAVADEIVRIVGLPAGTRPMRSLIDFVGDGASEVFEVSERVRIEF